MTEQTGSKPVSSGSRRIIECTVDVSSQIDCGEAHHVAASVFLPAELGGAKRIIFGFPGGGFNRRYYDLSERQGWSQADYLTCKGFVFVACDHPGTGDSTRMDPFVISLENMAACADRVVSEITERLSSGTLVAELGPMEIERTIGMGQSMGGGVVIVAQAMFRTFDAIAILGWSAIQEVIPLRGGDWLVNPGLPRDADLRSALAAMTGEDETAADVLGEEGLRFLFHWETDDPELMAQNMHDFVAMQSGEGTMPIWREALVPPCASVMVARDAMKEEAGVIDVPVLIGAGERDCLRNPELESAVYVRSPDVSLLIVKQMAHMHNFAVTRHQLWEAIASFAGCTGSH